MDPSNVKRRLTCILAADAFEYSKHMGRDEEDTIRVLAAHRSIIDGIIAFHQGRIVGTAGDSVLAEFSSAVEAVRCAVEIQDALKTRNDSLPEHRQLHFRVGVNLGDVVVRNNDLLGDGVNVAARLEGMAEPGGICISSSVYDQITGKLDLGFHDIGEQTLKNIARPIRVYRVSGAVPPTRPAMPPAASAPIATAKRGGIPLAIGAVVVAALGAGLAWQAGWFRSSLPTTASSAPQVKLPAPAVEKSAGTSAAGDATAARAQAESETQRLRAEVEALKKQTEAELARARADADAERKTRAKAEADAAAAHKRAQAETEAVLARRKGEAGAAADSPATRTTKASDSQALPARKAGDVPPGAQERSVAGTTASVASFDGTWIVTVDCPRAADGASGFTFDFPARVNDGLLKGEFGTEGAPGWLRLEGRIQTDGSAKLDAKGLTGDPKFNLKGVQKGVPYAYDVAARFEGSRGTGRRLQLRPCELRFVKQ